MSLSQFRWTVSSAATLAMLAAILSVNLAWAQPGRAELASSEAVALASQLVDGLNQERGQAGLPPLAEDWALDSVAADRSSDMVSRHYFSHTNPDGQNVFNILDARGIAFYAAGENLAWNTADSGQASAVALQAFMASPPHRANILNASFSSVGVGVAMEAGRTVFTVVFLG